MDLDNWLKEMEKADKENMEVLEQEIKIDFTELDNILKKSLEDLDKLDININ